MKCECKNVQIVWAQRTQNGELCEKKLRHQCLDCGRLGKQMLPFTMARENTPKMDIAAHDRWRKQNGRHTSEEWSVMRAREREQWRASYYAYLDSNEWQLKRRRALERADYLCEGCGEEDATEVHHLSYEHVGNEFLWELKAVCQGCHMRVHGIKPWEDEVVQDNYWREIE